MKQSIVLSSITAILLSIPAFGSAALDPDPCIWQLREGGVVRARFVGFDSDRVMLNERGRFREIRFDLLAPGSREKARRLMDGEIGKPAPPTPLPAAAAHGIVRRVTTTAYSHAEADHIAYGRRSALGSTLRYGHDVRSAAADWSVYPAGTLFRVAGQPWTYVVDDYGSALVGTGTIDLYQPDMSEMKRWGRRRVEITILRWGSFDLSARILSGRARHDHCRAMLAAIERTNGLR